MADKKIETTLEFVDNLHFKLLVTNDYYKNIAYDLVNEYDYYNEDDVIEDINDDSHYHDGGAEILFMMLDLDSLDDKLDLINKTNNFDLVISIVNNDSDKVKLNKLKDLVDAVIVVSDLIKERFELDFIIKRIISAITINVAERCLFPTDIFDTINLYQGHHIFRMYLKKVNPLLTNLEMDEIRQDLYKIRKLNDIEVLYCGIYTSIEAFNKYFFDISKNAKSILDELDVRKHLWNVCFDKVLEKEEAYFILIENE